VQLLEEQTAPALSTPEYGGDHEPSVTFLDKEGQTLASFSHGICKPPAQASWQSPSRLVQFKIIAQQSSCPVHRKSDPVIPRHAQERCEQVSFGAFKFISKSASTVPQLFHLSRKEHFRLNPYP
jgi:hypothetical protein